MNYGWGFFGGDDCTLHSVAFFLWFESVDEMLAFIAEIGPVVDLNEEEAEALKGRLYEVRAALRNGRTQSLDVLMKELEEPLKGHLYISWMGQFSSLCRREGKFAADLIDEFFDDESEPHEDTASARTISEDAKPAFVEFLKSYGH